jgi:hypothetical protein
MVLERAPLRAAAWLCALLRALLRVIAPPAAEAAIPRPMVTGSHIYVHLVRGRWLMIGPLSARQLGDAISLLARQSVSAPGTADEAAWSVGNSIAGGGCIR